MSVFISSYFQTKVECKLEWEAFCKNHF